MNIIAFAFLLALWAPPLAVVACALLLLMPDSRAHRHTAPAHAARLMH
jgi:hypothetical protein